MSEVVYICTGGCGAIISKAQYDKGLVKCGTDGCKNQGVNFEKRLKCRECGFIYQEQIPHSH